MATEKATAIVLRCTDWSETSRIVTFWAREQGKLNALAKGGRRQRSTFENALDLLTVCSIVFIRKSPGVLNLLTEARVERRFPELTRDLTALYGGYYVAELLSDWTEESDPNPELFDFAVTTLERLGAEPRQASRAILGFELSLLQRLGHGPALDHCARCGRAAELPENRLTTTFSVAQGGWICPLCRNETRDRLTVSVRAIACMRGLQKQADPGELSFDAKLRVELRRVVSQYVTHWLGRRPRMLRYLEQGT